MKNKQTLKREVERLTEKRNVAISKLDRKYLIETATRFGKLSSPDPVNYNVTNKTDAPELNHYISILEEDIRVIRKVTDSAGAQKAPAAMEYLNSMS